MKLPIFSRERISKPERKNVKIDTNKILRLIIAGFMFCGIMQIYMTDPRMAQELLFNVGCMALILLVVDNIWITLFGAWTLILFGMYRCQFGHIYVSNIFSGILLYYMTKQVFKKEHIGMYVKVFMWFVLLNILYCIPQVLGKDFLFSNPVTANGVPSLVQNMHPGGFMLNEDWMGMLIVFALPLFIARTNIWLGLVMFIPLFIAKSSMNIFSACCVYTFCAYFKMSKKIWVGMIVLGLIMGMLFFCFVDKPDMTRFDVWTKTVAYAQNRPIIGWGLDSFRNSDLPHKKFIFAMDTSDKRSIAIWDNPHNLYISLLFEFGLVGLFILFGYLRQLVIWFRRAIKEPYVIGLAGFALAAVLLSVGHFPMYLSRFCMFIIPMFAIFEVLLTD